MAITLLEDIVNRFIVNSPADHTVEEYSGNTNVSAINSVLVYSRKENVKVFARVTATQVWETLGVVGNDLNAVSGHGTEYRKDAVFNVTTMDRVSIISLGAETTARIVFNPSLPTEALSNATPSGGSTTSQTIVSDMAQNQITTLAIASGTTPIVQIYEDTVIPGVENTELDVLRLHLDSDLTDSSDSGHTVTAHGNAAVSTSEKKFGAGSLALDGTGDFLTLPAHSDWNLSSGDFTVEAWAYANSIGSLQGTILCIGGVNASAHLQIAIDPDRKPLLGWNSGTDYWWSTLIYGQDALATGQWHHFAAVFDRTNSTAKLYVNGVEVASAASTFQGPANDVSIGNISSLLTIGSYFENGYAFLDGYIDDVRITKGLARYTENFTVPAAAHPDTNGVASTDTLNKTSDFKIKHASDTSIEVTKLTAGSADVKIRLI